jgi:hypothetical protein
MKKLIVSLLLFFSSVHAAESGIIDTKDLVANELTRLDQLIEATSLSLEQQKQLRERVKGYQELHAKYLADPDDNERLYRLIKSAYTILESIKNQHLETAFEPDFLSELTVLSRPAIKSGLPKP